ncbi:multisubunit potassium/proton antiporter PhaG subunit [Halospina denitrificans]|uniref:Multisubunit potassium/proton antiporter PhaG subunit n=2 Tax=Halospina denitrificans TaxID=332522 RepID=A0A4R7JKC4_9GAMM|nr:multisubunit potassium/proton antiporter PhaG subunit [Halospina denitrificans]
MEMPLWLDAIVAALILAGALVATIGSLGLARMPDFYMRLHGPTKASTLGVGATLVGSMLWFSTAQGSVSVQEILITVFLFATAPVSAHMMGRAALHRRVGCQEKTNGQPWDEMDRLSGRAAQSSSSGESQR